MQVIHSKDKLITLLRAKEKTSKIVGFVPTMGALHQGHLSLVKQAKAECEVVVVSIFINPTQFDNPEDFKNYPESLDEDIHLLTQNFEDLIIFAPKAKELYGEQLEAEEFDFGPIASKMEGKFRTGHFNGVGTVLKKFFKIVAPDKAYFGEKDYQQLLIVRKLVGLLNVPIEINGCPISRTENGLALSSRNKNLAPKEYEQASVLFENLTWAQEHFGTKTVDSLSAEIKKNISSNPSVQLDYFEICDAETLEAVKHPQKNRKYRAFIAANVGEIRLIDNIALN